jgi:ribosomal protein S3AE
MPTGAAIGIRDKNSSILVLRQQFFNLRRDVLRSVVKIRRQVLNLDRIINARCDEHGTQFANERATRNYQRSRVRRHR